MMRCSCCDFNNNGHDHGHNHDHGENCGCNHTHGHKHENNKSVNWKGKVLNGIIGTALITFIAGTMVHGEMTASDVKKRLDQYEHRLHQKSLDNEKPGEAKAALAEYNEFNGMLADAGVKVEEINSEKYVEHDAGYKLEKYEGELGGILFNKDRERDKMIREKLNRYLDHAGLKVEEMTGLGEVKISTK